MAVQWCVDIQNFCRLKPVNDLSFAIPKLLKDFLEWLVKDEPRFSGDMIFVKEAAKSYSRIRRGPLSTVKRFYGLLKGHI